MTIRMLTGDCRDVLKTLPAECAHCVVTSPPYFGLRDYGVAGQIGLEPTPAEYVAELVAVFDEVRRVLRADGTLWLNLGDSYASGKNLIGVPWRVAFALQAAGWWLRQDIIWAKPNPMPESVTDRCTKAHEYVFLLAKRERYYFDAEAIAETAVCFGRQHTTGVQPPKVIALQDNGTHGRGGDLSINYERQARNKRTVWDVATSPFAEAHFATFPPALIEPCILAGTSERGCCAKCGSPWVRQVDKKRLLDGEQPVTGEWLQDAAGRIGANGVGHWRVSTAVKTLGWAPSCDCCADVVPCVVLDPFAGAGTTGLVADRLGRNALLIELNPAYGEMAGSRIVNDAPLFVQMERA